MAAGASRESCPLALISSPSGKALWLKSSRCQWVPAGLWLSGSCSISRAVSLKRQPGEALRTASPGLGHWGAVGVTTEAPCQPNKLSSRALVIPVGPF